MTLTPAIDELIEKEWRCFFCDEVFTDLNLARDHFGHGGFWEPGCVQKMIQSEKSIRTELVRTEQYFRDAIKQRDEAATALASLLEENSRLREALGQIDAILLITRGNRNADALTASIEIASKLAASALLSGSAKG